MRLPGPGTWAACLTVAAALAGVALPVPAFAEITTFFSAGANCEGKPAATFTPGGAAVTVSLCATTTTELLCGSTVKLQPEDAADGGKFAVAAIRYGAGFPDPNSNVKLPYAIIRPAPPVDLGSTTTGAAQPPGANQLLATYGLMPQAAANGDKYVIQLSADSSLGVGRDGSCANASDAPMRASFTLTRKAGTGK